MTSCSSAFHRTSCLRDSCAPRFADRHQLQHPQHAQQEAQAREAAGLSTPRVQHISDATGANGLAIGGGYGSSFAAPEAVMNGVGAASGAAAAFEDTAG